MITIDKQQQNIINQLNFIGSRLEKLEAETNQMKEQQMKMIESLQQNLSSEVITIEKFKFIKDEIILGNKSNNDQIDKISESINDLSGHFQRFSMSLDQTSKIVIGLFLI